MEWESRGALIIGIILVVLIGLFLIKRYRRKAKFIDAAYGILKEDALNDALKPQTIKKERRQSPDNHGKKKMLHLEVKGSKPVISYVFNPDNIIAIGRRREGNTICLNDVTVSAQHCEIFGKNNKIYIRDLGSSNQTIIKRRLKIFCIEGMDEQELHSGDIISVGKTRFKVYLFYCNAVRIHRR